MENHLSGPGLTILLILVGFILAINLSLVFAFLHRKRDEESMRQPRNRGRAPWESRLDESTEELSRRVAGLRGNDEGDKPEPKPPSSS